MRKTAAQLLLVANLAVFWSWGLGFLVAPRTLGAILGFDLTTVTAVGDLRAMYGGLCLAVGVLFFRGLRDTAWHGPAVQIATLGCVGLAVGRVATFATEGATSPLLLVLLAMELGGLALGVFALTGPAKAAASPTAAALPR